MLAKDLPESGIFLFIYHCQKKLSFPGLQKIHSLLIWKYNLVMIYYLESKMLIFCLVLAKSLCSIFVGNSITYDVNTMIIFVTNVSP